MPEPPVRRPVTVLALGGTIAMRAAGPGGALPALDAEALAAAASPLAAVPDLEVRTVMALPGAHLSGDDALDVARQAGAVAGEGRGVVVTSGTDTLEELAVLCDALCEAGPGRGPIALTGAIRPASAPGADGPANLVDAVAVAGAPAAEGLGAVLVFAGEVHEARRVRKVDATSPRAFGSPAGGPLGYVAEGRLELLRRAARRPPAVAARRLAGRVPIVTAGLGDDGWHLETVVAARPDGVVLVALGVGHVSPGLLDALAGATAAGIPVAVCSRPERGAVLRATYGFRGAEGDVRATGALSAGDLSPQAARTLLMAGIGAGLDPGALAALLAPHEA